MTNATARALPLDERLRVLRTRFDPTMYATAREVWGPEVHGIAVLVDPSGQVLDLRVSHVPDTSRTPTGLRRALLDAVTAAEAARLVASAEDAGTLPDEVPEDRPIVIRPLRRLGPRAPITPEAVAAALSRVVAETTDIPAIRHPGSSREHEVTVTASTMNPFASMDVDARWLEVVDATMLRHALKEAFTATREEHDR